MEPTIKGWMWNISFYPADKFGGRVIRNIFWYDSSNDLEFTKHTGEYQILIPESEVIGSREEIQYVHKHLKEISERELMIIRPYENKWVLNVPPTVLSRSVMLSLG